MNRKRILVVDDEPGVTRALKLNLESGGLYEVLTENDPRQAVQTAQLFRPDVILLDVVMPEMDGGEVAAQLRRDPRLRTVPLLFVTALVCNEETNGRRWLRGSETFLAKPVDVSELLKQIEEALSPQVQTPA